MPDRPPDGEEYPRIRAKRPALWLLLIPAVLYCAAPVVANSIEPRVLGVPFLLVWIIGATILSPLVIWVVSRLDPAFKEGAVEPLPIDALDALDDFDALDRRPDHAEHADREGRTDEAGGAR